MGERFSVAAEFPPGTIVRLRQPENRKNWYWTGREAVEAIRRLVLVSTVEQRWRELSDDPDPWGNDVGGWAEDFCLFHD